MSHSVLIVDDSSAMRKALCRLFKAAGEFRVCGEASNGAEAVDVARNLKPDLVILDLCMQGMNGLETARLLKSQNPHAKVILYTMNAEEIAAQEAFRAGVGALVSKAEGMKTFITKARGLVSQTAA